ncbi:MAG: glycosyltransferase [Acidobacteria bacterium]|nr:glycosyltransferase [Acidobacteriota bacterium]
MPVLTVAIAVAVGIVLMLRKARFHYERLPKIPYVAGAQLPDVAVIIPARNEEAGIASCVASFPPEIVTVADDHSEDRTAEIARELEVRVIEAPALADGKMGKPNACMAGAQASAGEWLLFVDADTHYARVFLPSLLNYAVDEELEMVSVFLNRETGTLAGKILLPYAFALYFAGVNSSRANGRPPSEWPGGGRCLLITRKAYDAIGGHAAVEGAVLDDVALAKRAAAKGVRSRVARAEHMGFARMDGSFGAILNESERKAFRLMKENPFGGVQTALTSILLAAWLPLLALLLYARYTRQAILFALVPILILFPWYRSATVLLAPVAIYLYPIVALRAVMMGLAGARTMWKGREV